MQRETFETSSKCLEEFLHVHDIRWISSYKNLRGLTIWVYENSAYLKKVVEEYREILNRRIKRRA